MYRVWTSGETPCLKIGWSLESYTSNVNEISRFVRRRLWTCAFITAPLLLLNDEFHLLHVLSITFNLFLSLFAVIWRLQLWWIPSRHNSSVYKRTLWCRGTLWMCCICPPTLTQFPACEPLHAILDITFRGNFTTPEWMVYFWKENFLTFNV